MQETLSSVLNRRYATGHTHQVRIFESPHIDIPFSPWHNHSMRLPFTFPLEVVPVFCILLTLFSGIVIGCNYAFRKLANGKTAILVPIALDVVFILYYIIHCDFNTEASALEYLFASHLPLVAISFLRKILKLRDNNSHIVKCVLGASILLYVFAIGYIVFALAT